VTGDSCVGCDVLLAPRGDVISLIVPIAPDNIAVFLLVDAIGANGGETLHYYEH
jgi:hypothetical protein